MDDDSSGSLDMAEFTKAMRECELVDLSKKAIEHIFRYLDADDSGNVLCSENVRILLLPIKESPLKSKLKSIWLHSSFMVCVVIWFAVKHDMTLWIVTRCVGLSDFCLVQYNMLRFNMT